MASAASNGTRKLLYWLAGIAVVISLSVGGYFATTLDAAGEELSAHEKMPGHPVMIERVDGIARKLDGIENVQHEQSATLGKILRAVEKG